MNMWRYSFSHGFRLSMLVLKIFLIKKLKKKDKLFSSLLLSFLKIVESMKNIKMKIWDLYIWKSFKTSNLEPEVVRII